MAAAALGFAARKIGGHALRQTQETVVSRLSPAVELGQRQLVPRFIHTEQQTHSRGGEKERVLKRIQRMKEELYDEMAEADEMYGRDKDPECRMNKQLLRELTDHVCRRNSGDAVWDAARSAKATGRSGGFHGHRSPYTGASCLLEEAAKRVWAAFFSKR
ncbi:hypothetical protein CFC21_078205 [Triticum aestivum]|uniref:Uncharacterized protein n=2 Tax=Triticum aestivum TaxID=4565 RepID=A0A9R1HYC4_WHEAT|nr:uncharacterized protein LOC123074246 isoform X2 [Triticum aestivum]KAF7073171.1 hypothetical protein CFC21_078205 [Triticum aestivum]